MAARTVAHSNVSESLSRFRPRIGVLLGDVRIRPANQRSSGACGSERARFAVIRCCRTARGLTRRASSRPPAMMMALHIWSLSHGIASLFARGDEAATGYRCRRTTCGGGVLIYLRGLGFPIGDLGTDASRK